ncbi:MAG: hypothetical protein IJ859_08620 [Synergistaceae bacterium]|nr:hypothetical protein [Synergistaceae bacterium]MBR2208850.1 hypothetical protein [Synergistaceae bacterium]
MPVTSDFKKAIKEKNVGRVRIMMKDSLVRDPSFEEFDEMTREAEKYLGSGILYDRHDGETFSTDKSDWNKAYMNNLLVDLMSNFSCERLDHLKSVCGVIYADEIKNSQQAKRVTEKHQTSREKNSSSLIFIIIAAILIITLLIFIIMRNF